MTVFDRIKKLADKRGVSVSKVALDLGFSENLFYQWKSASPKSDRLEAVADYFNVSVDYLLGREEKETETELRKALENVLSFDGEEMTENDKEAIISYMMGRKGK